MNEILGASSAMDAIRRRRTMRVHAAVPALTLLAMEDRFAASIEWKTRLTKAVADTEHQSLMSVRQELERRPVQEMAEAREEFRRRNKIWTYFPDEGPFRRELYPKHIQFFEAGKTCRERGIFGGNRTGKTDSAAYEVTCHMTGRYPKWWPGLVLDEAPEVWIVNKSAKDVRDINEAALLGLPGDFARRGTGMIPAHLIESVTPKAGTPSGYEFINITHVSGHTSQAQSKSFDQGREAFQGRSKKIIWLDEEAPEAVYTECLLRTLDCDGFIILTYTPLLGLTELTINFLEGAGVTVDSIGKIDAISAGLD